MTTPLDEHDKRTMELADDYALAVAGKPSSRARAALEAHLKAQPQTAQVLEGWRPIDTAPKDGSAVLVISAKSKTPAADIAHWSDDDQLFRGGYADDWASMAQRGLRAWHDAATHWMPLPPPPQPTQQPEEETPNHE